MHKKTNLDDEAGILELLMREAAARAATGQDTRRSGEHMKEIADSHMCLSLYWNSLDRLPVIVEITLLDDGVTWLTAPDSNPLDPAVEPATFF